MAKHVQCVPGGHQVEIEKAYWCHRCNVYICYRHLVKSGFFEITVTCRKGHHVVRAIP